MKDFFLSSGIVIICIGLVCLIRPQVVTGAPGRRPALSILLAGVLAAVGSTFAPPDAAAAAAVRERLTATLDAGQPARQQVVDRWAAAQAALPGGKVPARFLRWNTSDPVFGTNLNLIPAAAYTEGLKPEEIIARSATVPPERVGENPTRHIGTILKYSGKVLHSADLPLDSSIARVLQRSDTSFTVVWVEVSEQRWVQFMMFDGPTDLANGDSVTVYGYVLGVISADSKTPVLFGKVVERR